MFCMCRLIYIYIYIYVYVCTYIYIYNDIEYFENVIYKIKIDYLKYDK